MRADQVACDLFHFFGQQRGAVYFQQPQRTLHLVHFTRTALQQRQIVTLLDMRFERRARISQRHADLARRYLQGLCCQFGHLPAGSGAALGGN